MYQSTATRFIRSKNNDIFVNFMPLLLVVGIRGVIRNTNISSGVLRVTDIILAGFLIIAFYTGQRFYFRSFRYTLVDRDKKSVDQQNDFPDGSLTVECLCGSKARIYEQVMAEEMLCLTAPGESVDLPVDVPAKVYRLTTCALGTAHRLYYRQDGVVYCAVFHPDEQQAALLRSWIGGAAHAANK